MGGEGKGWEDRREGNLWSVCIVNKKINERKKGMFHAFIIFMQSSSLILESSIELNAYYYVCFQSSI